MNEQRQSQFFGQVYTFAGLVAGLVAIGLVLGRYWYFALGLVVGTLIGLLMLHGTVLLGNAMVRPPGADSVRRAGAARMVAVQVGKYAVGLGALYALISFTQANVVGIVVGYGIPIAVLLLMSLRLSTSRQRTDKDK